MAVMRFTIREIICLTVVVAVSAAWWFDRRQQRIQHQELLEEMVHERRELEDIHVEALRQKIYDARERQAKWRKDWVEKWAQRGHNVYLPPEEQSALYTPAMKALAPPKTSPQE